MPSWWLVASLFLAGFFGRDLLGVLRSRPEPTPAPGPYDWRLDGGLLDVWAREAEGELLSVVPQSWVTEAEEKALALELLEAGRPLASDEATDNAKRFIEEAR